MEYVNIHLPSCFLATISCLNFHQDLLLPNGEAKVLVLPTFKIDDEDHWINDLGGDSMNYVELVQEIDHEFNIEIEEEKYGVLTCVNDFVEEIARLKK